jgi:hypothetical protein
LECALLLSGVVHVREVLYCTSHPSMLRTRGEEPAAPAVGNVRADGEYFFFPSTAKNSPLFAIRQAFTSRRRAVHWQQLEHRGRVFQIVKHSSNSGHDVSNVRRRTASCKKAPPNATASIYAHSRVTADSRPRFVPIYPART